MSVGVSVGARRQLDTLARAQPESGPWLALVTETLHAAENPVWDQAAGAATLEVDLPALVPHLTGATVPLDRAVANEWVRRLLTVAADAAGPDVPALAVAARSGHLDAVALLEAAINQDEPRLAAIAAAVELDPNVLAPIAQLATVPLLQACRRLLAAAVSPDWHEGCCPVCGAWPALAEVRGLQRARRLRCSRCGGDWGLIALRCPYCGTNDHQQLGALVPEGETESRRAETCTRCRGYLKTVATLRPWAADEVGLADLATVELDLAALDHDYARPHARALALGLRLVEPPRP